MSDPSVDDRSNLDGLPRHEFYNKVKDISSRSFQQYAKDIGAEYYFTDQDYFPESSVKHYLKFFYNIAGLWMDPFFDSYENVLYVDTDIVCNTKENIFDQHTGEISGVLESDIKDDRGKYPYAAWDIKQSSFQTLVSAYEANEVSIEDAMVLPPNNPSRVLCYNTGVLVWSKDARVKAREKWDHWERWFNNGIELKLPAWANNDQFYISAQCVKHDMDMNFLDQTWNDSPHYANPEQLLESNFLHYSGGELKKQMLRRYEQGWFPTIKPEDKT